MGSTDVLKMIQVQNSHLNAEFISLPFSEDVQCLVNESEMKTIVNFSPDFIWIGLSSPKQVRLASYIKKRLRMTSSSSIFCVGAAFDLYVGKQKSPSDLIKRVGLEWFFRLVHSPGRLWKRYMVYSVLGLTKLAIFVKKN
jgi:N-acetylglucosaminyldiphosphoundecaprenol N-acetyl-beta-D-mannosaminyltransferase